MKPADHNTDLPLLLVSNGCGAVIEVPGLCMAGMSLDRTVVPDRGGLTPLPRGSSLFELPGRVPVGYDPPTQRFIELPEYQGSRVWAVAVFIAPGHAQVLHAAYRALPDAPRLPLYSYTAVGWRGGRFVCATVPVDRDQRHNLADVDAAVLKRATRIMLRRFSRNRLVRHLVGNCGRRYQCPTATSFVLGRCECAVPVSAACNASCLGCISHQPAASRVTASHRRLAIVPTAEEIAEFAVPHLQSAPRAIVSFGQGCEGEPLLAADVAEDAILRIRRLTRRGVINMNSNGSRPEAVGRLCRAGLDSIRISMNSAQPNLYERYFRPREYSFADVVESMRRARNLGIWVSVNYFLFPVFTDHPREIAALDRLIAWVGIDMLQIRTLNIDPQWYGETMRLRNLHGRSIGVSQWLRRMRERWPGVLIGCFNPAKATMARHRRLLREGGA